MGKRQLRKIIEKMLSGEYRAVTDEGLKQDPLDELAFLYRQLGVLCESDQPFYYSKVNRNVLIVDHVTFDSENNGAAQGDAQAGIFLTKRRVLTKSQTAITGRYKLLPPVSKGSGSAKNYLINCMAAFLRHYAFLEEYKNTLRKEGLCAPSCRIKTCFFVEDTTPLGSYIMSAEGMQELVLGYVKQFLDLFEKSPKLDYVFSGCFKGRSNSLYFIRGEDIPYYRKNEIDLLRRNYFTFDVNEK
jgi:hypothetical protein